MSHTDKSTDSLTPSQQFCRRCSHSRTDHLEHKGLTDFGTSCNLCECPALTVPYKKHITALRTAARTLRGYPLQPRLFAEDTHQPDEKDGTHPAPSPERK